MPSVFRSASEFFTKPRRGRASGVSLSAALLFLSHCGGETPSDGDSGNAGVGATSGAAGSAGKGGGAAGSSGSAGTNQAGGSSGASGNVGQGGTGGSAGVSGSGTGGASGSESVGGSAGVGGSSGGSGDSGASGNGGASGEAGTSGAGTGGTAGSAGSTSGAGGAGGTAGGGGGPSTGDFILGADISWVQEDMDLGTRYADTDGTEKDILDILKAHGFNYIRLRLFVEPNAPFGYAAGSTGGGCAKAEAYCDRAHTIEFAQAVKAKGMGFLLDLHYSDTWADPAKQIIPASFRSATTIGDLANRVRTYTTETVTAFVNAGARPDMVQVGNEITPGMLIHVPDGDTDCWGNNSATASVTGSTSNWDNLGMLLDAGIDGVKAVDESIEIMLHVENTDDLDGVLWWVDNALDHVEFDVLGLSAYVAWQGEPSVWRNTFETLAEEFPDLSFAIAEYNPERTEANHIMRDLPDGRGRGTFFWEPTHGGTWGEPMFTANGNVMRANAQDFAEFDALRDELGL
jgi:arabinogalactan endo-1,4-beta-galactosidase